MALIAALLAWAEGLKKDRAVIEALEEDLANPAESLHQSLIPLVAELDKEENGLRRVLEDASESSPSLTRQISP